MAGDNCAGPSVESTRFPEALAEKGVSMDRHVGYQFDPRALDPTTKRNNRSPDGAADVRQPSDSLPILMPLCLCWAGGGSDNILELLIRKTLCHDHLHLHCPSCTRVHHSSDLVQRCIPRPRQTSACIGICHDGVSETGSREIRTQMLGTHNQSVNSAR